MQTYAAKELVTRELGDVVRVDHDGLAYLAMIDNDNFEFDACGASVCEPMPLAWHDYGYLPEDVSCCGHCKDVVRAHNLVARVWNYYVDIDLARYENDVLDYQLFDVDEVVNRMHRVARRFGFSVAWVNMDYYGTWSVSDHPDFERAFGSKLIVSPCASGFATSWAREFVAYRNGEAWVVGTMPVAEADELGDFATPHDCDGPVHGYVWGNVNDYGESAPTADELIAWV